MVYEAEETNHERLFREVAEKLGFTAAELDQKLSERVKGPSSITRFCVDPDDFAHPELIPEVQWKHVENCSFCTLVMGQVSFAIEEALHLQELMIVEAVS